MRSFCLKVAAFALLQVVVFAMVWNPVLPRQHNYLAATIDKHRRLAELAPPRLILVGGCSMAYGIDSGRLEQELGLSVVNMGITAGLGLFYMLNEVESSVACGDVVLFALEYDYYGWEGGDLVTRQLIEYRPASLWELPRPRWKRFLDRDGLAWLGSLVRRSLFTGAATAPPDEPGRLQPREGFNKWGDYVEHGDAPSQILDLPLDHMRMRPGHVQPPTVRMLARLVEFTKLCEGRGARFIISWPPHARDAFDQVAPEVARLEAVLRGTPGLTILDVPGDYVYERSWFYDTSYHCTRAGGGRRTSTLSEHLRRHLGSPEGPGAGGAKRPG